MWARTDAIPFDAAHRFMATLNHDHEHHACIFLKAPERVLAMCKDQRCADGHVESLKTAYWNEQAETIAALGQRVLAAIRSVPSEHTVLEHEDVDGALTLLGMVGLIRSTPHRSHNSGVGMS